MFLCFEQKAVNVCANPIPQPWRAYVMTVDLTLILSWTSGLNNANPMSFVERKMFDFFGIFFAIFQF